MKTSKSADPTTLNPSIASQPESLAKTGPLQEEELESKERDLASFLSLRESCRSFDPVGLSSRMYPDFSVATEAETLQRSSGFSWSSAGMGYRGVCSTANFSESPNVAVVCTLSDILEPHAPRRFFLSPKAAAGILRRAKKRGRTLHEHLRRALESIATRLDVGKKTITTSSPPPLENLSSMEDGKPNRPISSPQVSPQDREGLVAEGQTMEPTLSTEPSKAIVQEDGRQSQGSTLPLFRMLEEEPETRPTRGKESGSKREAHVTPSVKPIATELHSPLPRTNEEKSGQAKLPRNSPQEEESPARGTHALPLSTPGNSEILKAATRSESNLEPKCQTRSPAKDQAPSPTPLEKTQGESDKATIPTMSVRRLTPTECETLQGFPKGWTIPGNFLCSPKEWTRPATKR